jgi:hypothetical protein
MAAAAAVAAAAATAAVILGGGNLKCCISAVCQLILMKLDRQTKERMLSTTDTNDNLENCVVL